MCLCIKYYSERLFLYQVCLYASRTDLKPNNSVQTMIYQLNLLAQIYKELYRKMHKYDHSTRWICVTMVTLLRAHAESALLRCRYWGYHGDYHSSCWICPDISVTCFGTWYRDELACCDGVFCWCYCKWSCPERGLRGAGQWGPGGSSPGNWRCGAYWRHDPCTSYTWGLSGDILVCGTKLPILMLRARRQGRRGLCWVHSSGTRWLQFY